MTEAVIRSIAIQEVDTDSDTGSFRGTFAPYNEVIEYDGQKERYEPGVFADATNTPIYYNHGKAERGGDMPIGRVSAFSDSEAGADVEASFYNTARAQEARSLVKDGHLNALSASFVPTQFRMEDDVMVYEKAALLEVSLVERSAYPSAKISEVRSESQNTKEEVEKKNSTQEKNMTEVTYDDSEIRSGLENLERRFEVLKEEGSNTKTGTQFRSAGEALKALASNDSNAKTEFRAYTGAVLADSHTSNDWHNDLLVIVNNGRPLANLFDHGTLDSKGNFVEYPKVSGTTGDVALQAAEGDNLAYLEVGITTATAPVKTYGGYSEVSRQVIERSDVAYLDSVLKFQAASYAKVTNAAVGTALAAATPQTGTAFTLSSATGSAFIGAAVDGIQKISDNGQGATPDFVMVSADVWQKLATLVDGNSRPLFNINGDGANTLGNVNVRSFAGSLAGMPVAVVPTLAAKTFYVASSQAVSVWENPGAPVSLSDENIINLTKQFSLYGYMAVGVKNAFGLVKATVS